MTTLKDILKFKDGRAVDVKFPIVLKDACGNETYCEYSDDYWYKCEYSNDHWCRREYDANGNVTYYENSYDYWYKREYDANGNVTYHENSYDYWYKCEYDASGNKTYFENSYGIKQGTPRSDKIKVTAEGKTIEISKESARALGLVK